MEEMSLGQAADKLFQGFQIDGAALTRAVGNGDIS